MYCCDGGLVFVFVVWEIKPTHSRQNTMRFVDPLCWEDWCMILFLCTGPQEWKWRCNHSDRLCPPWRGVWSSPAHPPGRAGSPCGEDASERELWLWWRIQSEFNRLTRGPGPIDLIFAFRLSKRSLPRSRWRIVSHLKTSPGTDTPTSNAVSQSHHGHIASSYHRAYMPVMVWAENLIPVAVFCSCSWRDSCDIEANWGGRTWLHQCQLHTGEDY